MNEPNGETLEFETLAASPGELDYEFLADANGALLTRHPSGLAGALRKIKNDNTKPTRTANKAVSHLYFSNPFKNTAILSTHPPLDERIKRLENM